MVHDELLTVTVAGPDADGVVSVTLLGPAGEEVCLSTGVVGGFAGLIRKLRAADDALHKLHACPECAGEGYHDYEHLGHASCSACDGLGITKGTPYVKGAWRQW